jgi:biotin synthase
MPLQEVFDAAQAAKTQGATHFCMGAAWRAIRTRRNDFNVLIFICA